MVPREEQYAFCRDLSWIVALGRCEVSRSRPVRAPRMIVRRARQGFNTDEDAADLVGALERSKVQALLVPGTALQFERRKEIVRATRASKVEQQGAHEVLATRVTS